MKKNINPECNTCKKPRPKESFEDSYTNKIYKMCNDCRDLYRGSGDKQLLKRCDCCKKKVLEFKLYDFDGNYTGTCLSCRYNIFTVGDEPDDKAAEKYIKILEENKRKKENEDYWND